MKEISQDYVKSLFDYKDGNLYWKVQKAYHTKTGDLAGWVNARGYRAIQIDGKGYLAHRLIFLFHHGFLPEYLDHIDRNTSNNNITNLREATHQENCRNAKKHKSCGGNQTTSIYKGVHWNKISGKWMSSIGVDGKSKHLGMFTSEIEAAEVYNTAATGLFGKYACLNIFATTKRL